VLLAVASLWYSKTRKFSHCPSFNQN